MEGFLRGRVDRPPASVPVRTLAVVSDRAAGWVERGLPVRHDRYERHNRPVQKVTIGRTRRVRQWRRGGGAAAAGCSHACFDAPSGPNAAAASSGGGEAREDDAYASGLGRMSWSSRVLPPCATTSTNSVPWLAHAAVAWFMEVASSA